MEISRENFAPKMGTIKDRNGRDLVILKGVKKRWREYTELYKKILMNQITIMVWSVTQSQTFWSVKSSGPVNKACGSTGFQ